MSTYPVEINPRQVRMALNRLDDPQELGKLPLARSAMVNERLEQMQIRKITSRERGWALTKIILEARETEFPSDDQSRSASQDQPYVLGRILELLHIEKLDRLTVTKRLTLGSTPKLDRLHGKAVERLTEVLYSRNLSAQRRLDRQNSTEQLLKPIIVAFEKQQFRELLVSAKAVFALLYDMGFWDDYLDISEKAIAAAEALKQDAHAAQMRVGNLARVYFDRRQFSEAEAVAKVALPFAEKECLYEVQGEAYRILGMVKRERGDLDGSIRDFRKSQETFQKGGNDVRYMDVAGSLTKILRMKEQWNDAEGLLNELLGKYEKLENPTEKALGESMTRYRLGALSYDRAKHQFQDDPVKYQEHLNIARSQLRAAVDIDKDLGNRRRAIAFTSKHLCLVELAAGNYEEADRWFDNAKTFFQSLGSQKERDEIRDIEEQINSARTGTQQ